MDGCIERINLFNSYITENEQLKKMKNMKKVFLNIFLEKIPVFRIIVSYMNIIALRILKNIYLSFKLVEFQK